MQGEKVRIEQGAEAGMARLFELMHAVCRFRRGVITEGQRMRYWLMTWNPRVYTIDEDLRSSGGPTAWLIRRFRHELCEGDRFVLWRSGRGGIAATGRITGEAEFRDTPSPDRWEEAPGRAWFVPVAVDSWHDCVIPFKTLRADKRFDGMAFREMPGAPNPHPLTRTHWDALMSYL